LPTRRKHYKGRVSHRIRFALAAVVTATLLLLVQTGWAQDKNTIAVLVEGPKADTFRELIIETIPEGVNVMDPNAFRQALARRGLPGGKIGFALGSPGMKKTVLGIVRKTVEGEKLGGAIIARARAGRGGLELVLIFQGADAEPLVDTAASLKGNKDAQKKAVSEALAPGYESLGAAAPEPEPEPTPKALKPKPEGPDKPEEEEEEEEEEDDDDGDKKEFEPNNPGKELFNIYAGAEFGGRFFDYSRSEVDTPNLRPYDVFGVPGLQLAGEVYPMATLGIVVLSDIGITVSYMHAFGLDSQTEDAVYLFGTNWNRFGAGLRYRQRVAEVDTRAVFLGFNGSFHFQNFTFDPESERAGEIVDSIATVEYLYMRAGIDARIPVISWFALQPSFGFDAPLNSGEAEPAECMDLAPTDPNPAPDCHLYERFRDPTVYAIDMGLRIIFVLPKGFETSAGVEYTRFFSSFAPMPGDDYIAGGALDQYVSLRVGLGYVY
jgi:hypothetical protein